MKWMPILLGLVLVTAGCHAAASGDDDSDAAPTVPTHTVAVQQASVPVIVTGFGSLATPPGATASVASETGGKVLAVLVHAGERVSKGQALVQLQVDPQIAANLAKAQIAYGQARKERDRQEALVKAGVAAAMTAQSAESTYEAASADLALQQRDAQLALQNTNLVSPIGGVVTSCPLTPGSVLAPQAEAAAVSNPSQLWADVALSPDALANVRAGMAASVQLTDGTAVDGRVVGVNPQLDPQTQRGSVRIALAHVPASAAPGSFARATIVTGDKPGLLVPNDAVAVNGGETDVYVIADGKAHARAVTLGDKIKNDVEIRDGLKPGEQVAIANVHELSDGAAVALGAAQ
ncbi:MAG TPA: efflux RND transporter periplasmic adaptor subunit [Oscillatoriaceae cyanobacterium]